MRANKEYQLAKSISTYLKLQYPNVIFHFDLAGLNLSKTQSGMLKVIQGQRSYPDLLVAEPKGKFNGLFIELKAENIYKKDGSLKKNEHIEEQFLMLSKLTHKGYKAVFGCGLDECINIIKDYLQ
jgi:hypothetical protein